MAAPVVISDAGTADLPPSILNMTVPHVGHLPLIALRPFFMVSSTASTISFFALHLTQYPSGIEKWPRSSFMPCAVTLKIMGHYGASSTT